MRVWVALPLALPLAGVLSCTFLVQFHDEPGCNDGLCGDGSPAKHDASADVGGGDEVVTQEASGPDAPAGACTDLHSGYYCGDDGLNVDAGAKELVQCGASGGVAAETACAVGCLHIPAPFPDACDPCGGVADGGYCGSELEGQGFPVDNKDFFIQCMGGQAVNVVGCEHGCNPMQPNSACYSA